MSVSFLNTFSLKNTEWVPTSSKHTVLKWPSIWCFKKLQPISVARKGKCLTYSAIADSSNARRVTDSRGEKDFEDASPQCLANSSKDEGDGDGSFSMADGVTGEKLVASSSRSISNGKGIQCRVRCTMVDGA